MNNQNAIQLAKMQNSSHEARERAFKMEAVKNKLTPEADKAKKLRESCEGFESIFIQKIWEQMRATIPESTLLKGREEKFWQGMYDQELAKTMASAGGIGLADMMYEQLSRGLSDASKSAANVQAGQPSPFASGIDPAPLLNASGKADAKTPAQTDAPATNTATSATAKQSIQGSATALYAEVPQPQAPPAPEAEKNPAPSSGEAAANQLAHLPPSLPGSPSENRPDPVIEAALTALRGNVQGSIQGGLQQTGAATAAVHDRPAQGSAMGAQPPLAAMQQPEKAAMLVSPAEQAASRLAMQNAIQGLDQGQNTKVASHFTDALKSPVRRPSSGKRSVLPRADTGQRVPAGQPVNRNMPFARQQSRQAEAQAMLQGTQLAQTANNLPGPASAVQGSIGVEALQSFAAQQGAAQYVPETAHQSL